MLARARMKQKRKTELCLQLREVIAIQTQRKNYEAAAAELERTVHSIQRLLQNLESNRKAETARAKAEGRTPQPYSAGDFARAEGSLEWPLHGSLVGHFGPETHPKWTSLSFEKINQSSATYRHRMISTSRPPVP